MSSTKIIVMLTIVSGVILLFVFLFAYECGLFRRHSYPAKTRAWWPRRTFNRSHWVWLRPGYVFYKGRALQGQFGFALELSDIPKESLAYSKLMTCNREKINRGETQ